MLDWVDLVDAVGHDLALGGCKLAVSLVVTNVGEVVNHESDLVLVGDGGTIGLEEQFFVSYCFSNVD